MAEEPLKIYWVERDSMVELDDHYALWAYYDMGDGIYKEGYLFNRSESDLLELEKHFKQSIETLEYH
jgi:hypothetical protein